MVDYWYSTSPGKGYDGSFPREDHEAASIAAFFCPFAGRILAYMVVFNVGFEGAKKPRTVC